MNLASLLIAITLLVPPLTARAGEVRAAVAANFTAPAQKLAAMFQTDTGHDVKLSFGSTGKLYSQIKAGAPFDLLLAADDATPEKLVREGLGNPASRYTYAVGRLALWSRKPGFVDAKGQVLQGSFGKLAIANPKLAPYGAAAQEALESLGLWNRVQGRLVMGQSSAQTLQFADTGNADLAFIALSQSIQNGKPGAGSLWIVPRQLHNPIRQDALLLHQARDKAATEAFLKYLKSAKAAAVIQSYGYDLP